MMSNDYPEREEVFPGEAGEAPSVEPSFEPPVPESEPSAPLTEPMPLFPEESVYPDPIYPEEAVEAQTFVPDEYFLPEEASDENGVELAGETDEATASEEMSEESDEKPEEDPEAPECAEEPDALEQELMEVNALLNEEPRRDEKFLETKENSEEFVQMVNTPAEKAPIPARERPARKGRPRRKKGEGFLGIPNILATAVWLGLILVIGVTLGRMLWVCAADVLAFGREDRPVTITIYESDTIEDITDKLHKANLIRYPGLFKLYASFAVDEGEIRPGIWDLNTRYDYHALVSMMSPSSSRKVIEVMIPEGYSCAQIFALLEENKVCTAQDLAAYAATGELDFYWFLDGLERGTENCLEGYLFPDTYQFYTNDSPRNVLQKMLNNFDYRFTEEMVAQLPVLNAHISEMMRADGHGQEYIDSHQLTMADVVIVASLIEKETASAEEGYTIASVIYNRLFNWGDTPPYLNIDAAMVYALGGKTDLTADDLRIDHPYNTYLYTGLTPGPIANPGLASLKAALAPSTTPYYYYVLDPSTGSHHFSRTYEEHQAFIRSLGD